MPEFYDLGLQKFPLFFNKMILSISTDNLENHKLLENEKVVLSGSLGPLKVRNSCPSVRQKNRVIIMFSTQCE